MGKAENIKRAKKLKEAKRIKEQEEKIKNGFGPASIELKRRNELKGGIVTINNSPIKYSEVLSVFVSGIINKNDDIEEVRTKYMIASHAWNCSLMRAKDENTFQKGREMVSKFSHKDATAIFDKLTAKWDKEFSDYKRLIADVEIKPTYGINYDLSVATQELPH